MSYLVIAPTETIITLTYNDDNPNEFSYEHGVNRKIEGKEGIDAIGKRGGWNIYYKGVLVDSFDGHTKPIFINPEETIKKYEKNTKKSQINNKKMKNTLSIVCFLLLPLCVYSQNDRKNNVKVQSISPRYTQEELITIKQKIVQEGNKDDYYELLLQSKGKSAGWNSEYEFLLPYALILANKYEDGFACYEVYQLTKTFYEDNNMQIDPISSQFIMHYLLKGAQLGNKDCLRELENLKTNSCEDELKGQ